MLQSNEDLVFRLRHDSHMTRVALIFEGAVVCMEFRRWSSRCEHECIAFFCDNDAATSDQA